SESETVSEAASEEETTEEVSETESESETVSEAASEEETTEEASEAESEIETVSLKDTPRYTALDYVTLGEYKGLTVVEKPIEITDEEIQEVIDVETVETLTEGTVEEGDIANIDYEGKIDDVAFDGGTAEGYDLEIGSDSFIEGFEDGLVGIEVGSETDLYLTFPENYHSEEVAGKEVVFHVTVNSVQRVPELTDEVAAKAADGMTAEEYKESVRETLVEEKAEEQLAETKYELLTKVYENSEISGYPADKLEFNMKYAKSQYELQAQYYGMTLEDMLTAYGMTEEDLMAQLEETYKEVLTQEMVLQAVAETENLEITEDEYKEKMVEYSESLGADEATIEETYGEEWLRDQMRLDKAMDFLVDNAKYVEEEETEAVSETVTEEESEKASEAESESETVSEAESESETVSEASSEAESESETASEAESESESASAQSESETASETASSES
ncbi:MAG: trigger factor, partial [Eubacteriales bacterium]|nr:trigger factor [Eubacteriales bacterium]